MSKLSLEAARRREKISQAEWRRRRAEVARLVAAGEEQAAQALLAEAGVGALPEAASEPTQKMWEASPDAETGAIAKAADQPTTATSVASRARSQHLSKAQQRTETERAPATTARATPSTAKQAVALAKQARAPRLKKPKQSKQRKKATWITWARERPPWVASLAAHGAIIGLFSLLTFATFGEPGFSLTASLAEEDSWNETLAEVTLTDFESDADASLAAPIEASLDLSAEVELASLVEPVDLSAMTDIGDLMAISADSLAAAVPAAGSGAGGDNEAAEAGGGKPSGGRVSFFGAESEARRVVFVVDNSGSMKNGRMETTLLELDNAVRRLSSSQEFYVVFFSDQAYPMFFPDSAEEPLPATPDNKRRLTKWLHTVEICLGGRLLDAMEIAAGLEPDVTYLLTDGDIRSEYVTERLTATDAWPFTIHTLGMGARTQRHVAILNAIAANTGGVFRPVAANPAAVARSRTRPIRYHREPGPVWGSAVRPWK